MFSGSKTVMRVALTYKWSRQSHWDAGAAWVLIVVNTQHCQRGQERGPALMHTRAQMAHITLSARFVWNTLCMEHALYGGCYMPSADCTGRRDMHLIQKGP